MIEKIQYLYIVKSVIINRMRGIIDLK